MSVTNLQRRNSGGIVPFVIGVVSSAVAAILFLNRQYIIDQIIVWQYQPSSAVTAIVARTRMNEAGKFYFYASTPAIESAANFNKSCTKQEEGTAILGCYSGRRIYVYDVTNKQLDGIEEVTAAHEMLHAAYDRLSGEEKQKVDSLLEAEFEKLKHDEEFAERMAFYERTEPGERNNELHSIIGTEIPSIGSELEAYYGRYFNDRSEVVALHASYEAIFEQLEARSEEISAELTRLVDTINAKTTSYNKAIEVLNNDIEAFNRRANNGGFSSQSEFEAERAVLVARGEQLASTRDAISHSIARYNELREELAAVASESEALNRSIDSTLEPAPSV